MQKNCNSLRTFFVFCFFFPAESCKFQFGFLCCFFAEILFCDMFVHVSAQGMTESGLRQNAGRSSCRSRILQPSTMLGITFLSPSLFFSLFRVCVCVCVFMLDIIMASPLDKQSRTLSAIRKTITNTSPTAATSTRRVQSTVQHLPLCTHLRAALQKIKDGQPQAEQ